jgi:hypothetical protein
MMNFQPQRVHKIYRIIVTINLIIWAVGVSARVSLDEATELRVVVSEAEVVAVCFSKSVRGFRGMKTIYRGNRAKQAWLAGFAFATLGGPSASAIINLSCPLLL